MFDTTKPINTVRYRRLRWLGAAALALAVPGLPAMAQAVVATGIGTPFELAFWQSIDSSGDAVLYEAYLARFPNGTFGEIARARVVTLRARHAVTAPAAAAPPAVSALLPVPVPVPVAAPAPASSVVPPLTPAPAALDAPVAVAVTAPAPEGLSSAPSPGTMGQLLAALADSQVTAALAAAQPASAAALSVRAPSPVFALPIAPALTPVAEVTLPPVFCSAEARNAFHAAVYVPSVNAAKANNDAAASYMRQLQSLYDQRQLSHDSDTMNTIVNAARTYSQVAQTTFSMQAALVRRFGALMAVPVVPCAQTAMAPTQVSIK